MRKGILTLWALGSLVSLLAVFPHGASAESIQRFDVTAKVNADSSATIEEKIVYDFGLAEKHGIYRDIPYKYEDDYLSSHTSRIKDISVTDEKGNHYNFSLSNIGAYIRIKIGDADRLITGAHEYDITYTAERAVIFHDGFDELFWNVTGDQWQVPIASSTFAYILPAQVSDTDIQFACYEGVQGSTQACEFLRDNPYHFNKEILPGQEYSVAIGFPKGIVAPLTAKQKLNDALEDDWYIFVSAFIVFLTFIFCFVRWYRYGRDPKGRGTIVPQYDMPQGMVPTEAGGILNQAVSDKDISAEIIKLAVEGYLTIERTEEKHFLSTDTDYIFKMVKPADAKMHPVDKLLLESIFSDSSTRKLSAMKAFYEDAKDIKETTLNLLVGKGYYVSLPKKLNLNPVAIFQFVVFGIVFGVAFLSDTGPAPLTFAIALVISGFIFLLFSLVMPKKTVLGVQTREYLLGLKEYLQIAEKDRINFHNAPEKNPQLFEKLLPVAMVMGVEKAWAKEFEGIYTVPPSWYAGGNWDTFSTASFVHGMTNFSIASGESFSPPSQSSSGGFGGGGGFSGGGGGGGGGGSW